MIQPSIFECERRINWKSLTLKDAPKEKGVHGIDLGKRRAKGLIISLRKLFSRICAQDGCKF
jgi:hypothetical protein